MTLQTFFLDIFPFSFLLIGLIPFFSSFRSSGEKETRSQEHQLELKVLAGAIYCSCGPGISHLASIPRQEIGPVAVCFFFELLFSYVCLAISFYVFLLNLFWITHSYLPITQDTQDQGQQENNSF